MESVFRFLTPSSSSLNLLGATTKNYVTLEHSPFFLFSKPLPPESKHLCKRLLDCCLSPHGWIGLHSAIAKLPPNLLFKD